MDDGASVTQCERKPGARGQAHVAWAQQTPLPACLVRGHVQDWHERQQRRGVGVNPTGIIARNDEAATGGCEIHRRQPVASVPHVLVVLVAQAEVERQVVAHLPVVLNKKAPPGGATVLDAPADAGTGCRRVAEEEVTERVPAGLPRVGKGAPRVVGLFGPELQVEQVGAELQAVAAAVGDHVLVQLQVSVVAPDGRSWITERAVDTRRGDLRKAGVPRVRGDALQADLAGKARTLIQVGLPAAYRHPSDAQLVQPGLAKDARVAQAGVTRRPKPGTRASCRVLVPKGCTSSVSNVLNRANRWSAAPKRWSSRTPN